MVADLVYSKVSSRPARWVVAVPFESEVQKIEELEGKKIATELLQFTKRYFDDRNINVKIEFSWGATEAKVATPALSTTSSWGLLPQVLYLSVPPLWERFLRGEGALLAINAAIVVFAGPPLGTAALQLATSALVLALLYALNDWRDAEDDRRNPKKNQQLVETLVELRRPFLAWLVGLQVGLTVLAFAVLGAEVGCAVAAIFAVNVCYSWWLKGVPVADLLIVWAWGASYVAIVGPPWSVCVAVGLMTAIMHVFQIQEDRDVDAANHVVTTAVGWRHAAGGAVALLCAALYAVLIAPLGPWLALSAFVPLALQVLFADTAKAWMASRVYCGATVLAMLFVLHGHG